MALDGDSTMTRVFPEAPEAPDVPLDADAFEADVLVRVRFWAEKNGWKLYFFLSGTGVNHFERFCPGD